MLSVGDSQEVQRRYGAEDIEMFSRLSGVEVNAIDGIPEPLINALFSDLLGTGLPGPGTMYMKQHSRFLGVADINATLTARVEVNRIRYDKQLVNLTTRCVDDTGTVISEGEALVIYPHL